MIINHASLFSGIGGFDLASQWMGWNNLFCCEIDEFCQKVLMDNFPTTHIYKDINDANFNRFSERIDILTMGMPCQPFSKAGSMQGTNDERYLWEKSFEAIRLLKPKYILFENVPTILNIESGMVFKNIITSLESEKYQCTCFVIPCSLAQAPHIRERIFIIAYTDGIGFSRGCNQIQSNFSRMQSGLLDAQQIWKTWQNNQFTSGFCTDDDGVSEKLDKKKYIRFRRNSLKAYGNSVSPLLIYEIFNAIKNFEQWKTN